MLWEDERSIVKTAAKYRRVTTHVETVIVPGAAAASESTFIVVLTNSFYRE